MKYIFCLLYITIIMNSTRLNGQFLLENSQVNILLADSTPVHLFSLHQSGEVNNNGFYYLPTNMRLSYRDSVPEFTFMAFDKNGDGQNDGGIMHLLITWGLTKSQLLEAEKQLKTYTDSTAIILGPVMVESNQFSIGPDTELSKILDRSLRSKGREPLNAGGKMALSYFFSKEDTTEMEKILLDSEALRNTKVIFEIKINNRPVYTLQSILLERSMFQLIGKINNN